MLKHYVEFIFINPLRHKRLEVQERNEKSIVFPGGVVAYRFYDRNEVVADDGELLRGKRKNFSEKKFLVSPEIVENAIMEDIANIGANTRVAGSSSRFARRMKKLFP